MLVVLVLKGNLRGREAASPCGAVAATCSTCSQCSLAQEDDPARYAELLKDMERDTSAWDMAAAYAAHHVINPVDTRRTLTRLLEIHRLRLTGGVGQHLMRTWPTSY